MKRSNLLLVLIILTATFIQQPINNIMFSIGQLISFITALYLIFLLFNSRLPGWVPVVFSFILIILKISSLLSDGNELLHFFYAMTLCSLYLFIGLQLLPKDTLSLSKVMTNICVINLPLMLIQLVGGAAIFHLFRTDFHGDSYNTFVPESVLFVKGYLSASTVQARPSGFFASNNFFSLFLICTMILYWRNRANPQWKLVDFILVIVSVICFSKTVFISVIIFVIYTFFGGNKGDKKYSLQLVASYVIVLLFYRLLMPGLFLYQTNWDGIYLNYALRFYAILSSLGLDYSEQLATYLYTVRPDLLQGELHQSGGLLIINSFSRGLPIIIISSLILSFLLLLILKIYKNLRNLNNLSSLKIRKLESKNACRNSGLLKVNQSVKLFILVLIPIIFGLNLLGSPVLWFVLGVLFSPQSKNIFIPVTNPKKINTDNLYT